MENSVDIFPILAKQFDEPIVDSSMIPTFLLCQMVRKHCKVALGGMAEMNYLEVIITIVGCCGCKNT